MIWKDIYGYEGLYQVSDTGLVRSLDRVVTQNNREGCSPLTRVYKGRMLKLKIDKGYHRVELSRQGEKPKTYNVHRLVAYEFVNGYFEGAIVNHKDGNKLNNHVSNLEWCTVLENNVHAYKTGLKDACLETGIMATMSKYIVSVYKDGVHIIDTCGVEEFDNFGKTLGLKYSSMLNYFSGKVKQYKGYTFTRRLKNESC